MAFASVPCTSSFDEPALIHWRAKHLACALNTLDFPGPIARQGDVGSGDALIQTMRLTAAFLSAMAHAKLAFTHPERVGWRGGQAGALLSRALHALARAAKDIDTHHFVGGVMRMTPGSRCYRAFYAVNSPWQSTGDRPGIQDGFGDADAHTLCHPRGLGT